MSTIKSFKLVVLLLLNEVIDSRAVFFCMFELDRGGGVWEAEKTNENGPTQ